MDPGEWPSPKAGRWFLEPFSTTCEILVAVLALTWPRGIGYLSGFGCRLTPASPQKGSLDAPGAPQNELKGCLEEQSRTTSYPKRAKSELRRKSVGVPGPCCGPGPKGWKDQYINRYIYIYAIWSFPLRKIGWALSQAFKTSILNTWWF